MNLPWLPSTFLSLFIIKVLVALAVVVITFHALSLHPGIRNATHFNHSPSPRPQFRKGGNCLPQYSLDILNDLKAWQSSCGLPKSHHPPQWRVTTATAHFGKVEEHYQKALQTHVLHTMLHQTRLEVMCTPIIDSLWNKPAFLLSMLLGEMLKEPEERTEWIFWVDRDTIILDECRPATSFLPPRPLDAGGEIRGQTGDDDVQLIVTNDWNGLNNGVFLVRVGQWAIELFSAILAFRHYRPDVNLPFTEQSAMEIVMREPRFNKSVQLVPQTWFNTYPGGNASTFLDRDDEDGLADYQVRRGDFLIHFAGVSNRDRSLNDWTAMLGIMPKVWEEWRLQRNVTAGIDAFWKKMELEKTDNSSAEE
ncbi:hypothetical protein CkaCkLH20_07594 [Colletotrichum karsti]|uniref:Galactosyl transferase GMA12/MNN10 family protein n=1 Tax=Colletotrichum karsti TaxID=1095194 RepID=A0A9P6IA84_9PEZI|nr:uncharacterized protein CkaCkLH20_07594 [Colletotrichum karsti]KAF9874900.1 hypothetical protein CkaCkLH20_07594 [Colletotrichum karsti]